MVETPRPIDAPHIPWIRRDASGAELVCGTGVELDAVLEVDGRRVRVTRLVASMSTPDGRGTIYQARFSEGEDAEDAEASAIPRGILNGTPRTCAVCGRHGVMHVVTDSSGISGWVCWHRSHADVVFA